MSCGSKAAATGNPKSNLMWQLCRSLERARFTAINMLSSAAAASSSPSSGPKPPNVLIYQSDKDTTNPVFLRTRESLEASLRPERYVIYPLGEDDVSRYSPWKDNCRLLVVPPLNESALKSCDTANGTSYQSRDSVNASHDVNGDSPHHHCCHRSRDPSSVGAYPTLPPRVMEELISYVLAGGKLLSMRSDLNREFGLVSLREALDKDGRDLSVYVRDGVCDVENAHCDNGMEHNGRFSCLVPIPCGMLMNKHDKIYLGNLSLQDSILLSTDMAYCIPVEWNADMKWIDQNTNQSNNNTDQSDQLLDVTSHDPIPCVRELELCNNGRTVLSGVDICPVLPEGLDISPLVRLKKGVALRGRYLTQLLRRLGLECSDERLPSLTHSFLICSKENRSLFLSAIKPHLLDSAIPGKDISLRFITTDYNLGTPVDDVAQPSLSELTVITRPAPWQLNSLPFSYEAYFQALHTREMGRTLLHTPVISSTQLPFMGNLTFCQALRPEVGVVWVAAQQTKGKGRSGNAWISPQGSMMFSTALHLSPESHLSHHLPLLQHLVAVAVVHGVRSTAGYEDVPLRIKWPNDIYYKSQVKLGGILVSCLSLGNSTNTAVIGCGVNICNQYPTMSVNDAISLHNQQTGSALPPLQVEAVLASTFNTLERLLTLYEVQGEGPILELYYKYWLHSDAVVSLASHNEEKVVVVGLDKYGYLRVRRKGGAEMSLQPDGNSFDIMKGLIVMKN